MVSKDIIRKSFEDIISRKCRNSSKKAREIGSSVKLSVHDKGYTLTYDNGMSLNFDENNNMVRLEDDKDYPYLGSDAYDIFNFQKEILKNSGEFSFKRKERINPFKDDYEWVQEKYSNDYDFLTEYITNFATYQGMALNRFLIKKDYQKLNSFQSIVFNKKSHDHFVDLERSIPCDNESYVALRIQTKLYENDNIDKEHYRNNHHISMSVGADTDMLINTFAEKEGGPHRDRVYVDGHGSEGDRSVWRIYTKIDKGSGVKGLFFGNNVRDSPTRTDNDWECELNLAPNTKFVRDIIDEENHIIIQHIEV